MVALVVILGGIILATVGLIASSRVNLAERMVDDLLGIAVWARPILEGASTRVA
jgi:hypothetical protein